MQEKKKVKPIPLSMRGKKRYLLYELFSENKLLENEVHSSLWKTMKNFFGEFGCAENKIWLVSFNASSGKGILRCSNESIDAVKAAVLFLGSVGETRVVPKTILVSGGIKRLKEKIKSEK
jgi:ribonuclease P/MRP protein subunit POP5